MKRLEYICFISFNLDGKQSYYLDSFLVVDNDPIIYTERRTEATLDELSEVSSNPKDTCKTVDQAKTLLSEKMAAAMGETFNADNAAFYTLNLSYSLDDGKTWTDVTVATGTGSHLAVPYDVLYDEESGRMLMYGVSFNAPINDGAINNYVCYVHVNCDGPQIYYMDSFLVADNDEIVYVEKETAVVANELTDVPTALQAAYADTDALADTLTQLMLDEYGSAYAQNSKIMDLSLLVSTDGEQTWKDAKLSDIPIRGIEIRLDYPEGTSPETHDFKLIHMFSADSQRHGITAGDWESPVITEKEDGLYVTMLGFSPVVFSWSDGTEAPADTASVTPVLWIGAAVIALAAAAVTIIAKKRRNA